MTNPLAGNVNLFRQGAADLQTGLQQLQANVTKIQLSRLLQSANDQAQQIREQESNENKQRQQLQDLGRQLAFSMAGLGVDPGKVASFTKAVTPDDPAGGEIDRDLLVPGFGQGINKDGVKKFTTQLEGATSSLRLIQRLRQINNETGESVSPELRARATSLRNQLVGQSRLAIVGPGQLSDTERQFIMETVPAVANVWELDDRSEAKLQELESTIRARVIDGGVSAGFSPQQIEARLQALGFGGTSEGAPQAGRKSFGSSFRAMGQ